MPWRRKWQPIHSRNLAWRIPRTEETGELQSTGSQRVGHDSVTECTYTHTHTQKQYIGEHNILNTKKKKSPIVSQFALSSLKDFFFFLHKATIAGFLGILFPWMGTVRLWM